MVSLSWRFFQLTLLFASILIAGCNHLTPTLASKTLKYEVYNGKISLHVDSDPPVSWFAQFELQADSQAGELSLLSPFGNTLGQLSWNANEAVIQTGAERQVFSDFETALASLTGAAVSARALLAWLSGHTYEQAGWELDLSQYSSGRIIALRSLPRPQARLAIVLSSAPNPK